MNKQKLFLKGQIGFGGIEPNVAYTKEYTFEGFTVIGGFKIEDRFVDDIFTDKPLELPLLGREWALESFKVKGWWNLAKFQSYCSHFKGTFGELYSFERKVKSKMKCRRLLKKYSKVLYQSKNSDTLTWRRVATIIEVCGLEPRPSTHAGDSERKGNSILLVKMVDLDKLDALKRNGLSDAENGMKCIITLNLDRIMGFSGTRYPSQGDYGTKLVRFEGKVWEVPSYVTRGHLITLRWLGEGFKEGLETFGTEVVQNVDENW